MRLLDKCFVILDSHTRGVLEKLLYVTDLHNVLNVLFASHSVGA